MKKFVTKKKCVLTYLPPGEEKYVRFGEAVIGEQDGAEKVIVYLDDKTLSGYTRVVPDPETRTKMAKYPEKFKQFASTLE